MELHDGSLYSYVQETVNCYDTLYDPRPYLKLWLIVQRTDRTRIEGCGRMASNAHDGQEGSSHRPIEKLVVSYQTKQTLRRQLGSHRRFRNGRRCLACNVNVATRLECG